MIYHFFKKEWKLKGVDASFLEVKLIKSLYDKKNILCA